MAKTIDGPGTDLADPGGPGTGVLSWTPVRLRAVVAALRIPCRDHARGAKVHSTMCSGTDTACAIRSSAPKAAGGFGYVHRLPLTVTACPGCA